MLLSLFYTLNLVISLFLERRSTRVLVFNTIENFIMHVRYYYLLLLVKAEFIMALDKEIATLKNKQSPNEVSFDSIYRNVTDIFASYNLDLACLSDEEKDFYRKVHRYFSSLEYYASICFQDHINDRESRLKERKEIVGSFLQRVKKIVGPATIALSLVYK